MAMIRPRVLPLTILAIVLLLVQKTVALVDTAVADTPAAASNSTSALTKASSATLNWDSAQPPPAICPPDATTNVSEVAVLSSLRQRSAALDAREAALDRKQALVDASEENLTLRLSGLQAVEDRLSALSQTQTQAAESRWQALVSTYEAMDPQAAAGIFDGLDMNVLLPVLTRMNSRKAAVILADMSPDKARQATEMMAGQGEDINLGNLAPSGAAAP